MDLALREAKDLGTTSSLLIGLCPLATGSTRIVSITSYEIQAVNIRLQIVEDDLIKNPKDYFITSNTGFILIWIT